MAVAPTQCQGGLPQAGAEPSHAEMAKKEEERERRLAEALRENLRRRKAQARGDRDVHTRRPPEPESD